MEKKVKAEVIRRMHMLNLHDNVRKDFIYEDKLNKSEVDGMLYWLTDEEKHKVEEFEQQHGVTVYHVIKTETEFGTLLSLLYVAKSEEEWEIEREDISENVVFSYVINLSEPAFSEFGSIGIQKKNGGLVRTA